MPAAAGRRRVRRCGARARPRRCRLSIRRGRRRTACDHILDRAADGGARAEMGAHPVLDQRPRQLPDVDLGIELGAHALGHQHGLLQQQQLRLHRHLELLGDAQQLRQQAGDRDLVAGLAEDRLADRAAGLGEHLERLVGRHVAGAELHLGHGAVVAAQEGDQQLGEIAARVLVDAAHDAEIDRHDAALRDRRRRCRRACRHGRSRRGTPGRRRPRRTCA